jgi:type II secretory ATPase GspE/PulE/Tfp pilus assembly ATPase PilB-like protein
MEMDARLREMTFHRAPHGEVRETALRSGRLTALLQDGQRKVLEGTTSTREVLRMVAAGD